MGRGFDSNFERFVMIGSGGANAPHVAFHFFHRSSIFLKWAFREACMYFVRSFNTKKKTKYPVQNYRKL